MSQDLLDENELEESVNEVIEVLPVLQVLATPTKQLYKAITSFAIQGFREVTEGEFITISPEIVKALGIEDKLTQG